MTNSTTALTDLAVSAYADLVEKQLDHPLKLCMSSGDHAQPIIDGLGRLKEGTFQTSRELARAVEVLSDEPDLAPLISVEGKGDPMIHHPYGGRGQPFSSLVGSLLISASDQMYVLGLEQSKSSFARLALENYEQLRRAARGEQVRAYHVAGFSGISLPEGTHVQTPWGVLRPAPAPLETLISEVHGRATTSILATLRLTPIVISHETDPQFFPPNEQWTSQTSQRERMRHLLPLACALATIDRERWRPGENIPLSVLSSRCRCAPMVTFESFILPLSSGHAYYSGDRSFSPMPHDVTVESEQLVEIEEWTHRLERHHDTLQVATKRIVSAIAQRWDMSDALIDAVIAWESIVGTKTEGVFRVTAALAKLLEQESSRRAALRKELGKVYDVRSRVVHGELVNFAHVWEAADRAIDVCLRALRALYSRPEAWLTAKRWRPGWWSWA